MFDSLFASKNKKLVLKLQKEHKHLVELVGVLLQAYEQNDKKRLHKYLVELKNVALTHLMTEDVEFYRLVKDSKRSTKEIEKLVHEFETSFGAIKLALIDFLDRYTAEDALYDQEFIEKFKMIVNVLQGRIEFEETHLYEALLAS
jgi:hemerythrin